MDENNDGQIDYQEFITMMKNGMGEVWTWSWTDQAKAFLTSQTKLANVPFVSSNCNRSWEAFVPRRLNEPMGGLSLQSVMDAIELQAREA